MNPPTAFPIAPNYVEINTVRDICEPWIDIWGGDEWGESMESLCAACHTSYGFSDEDCALFAERLFANILAMKQTADQDPGLFWEPEAVQHAQAEAREARDYWLTGGNLGDWNDGPKRAKNLIDQMPEWMFGE